MRYIDFDGQEMAEFPEVQAKVAAGEIQPGAIMVNGGMKLLWDMPYSVLIEEFENRGALRISHKAS
ncbi:MAG: hypothetical protein IBX61_06330 [Thermoleophilia bacterium]|nr:hypothetical protein [Thermoleophilia bacterium]